MIHDKSMIAPKKHQKKGAPYAQKNMDVIDAFT